MNLNELKHIIEQDGGKVIIVENDRPTMVVMTFEEYKNKFGQSTKVGQLNSMPPRTSSFEPSLKHEAEELTIDDLPL